jgi:DNA invertase Pin-like site-specific DNA recombinase
VENNRESTARQYALADKAVALGWDRSQVITIDEDLGISGKVFVKRSGFDHLNTEVVLGRVGILLGLEVSRLARSNADWYRLLDMCAITDTLLADGDGVYHPGLFNDRLILGLKGTMSEAELSCLSWKWRRRSFAKIAERTYEKRAQALHRRRESSHPEATPLRQGPSFRFV